MSRVPRLRPRLLPPRPRQFGGNRLGPAANRLGPLVELLPRPCRALVAAFTAGGAATLAFSPPLLVHLALRPPLVALGLTLSRLRLSARPVLVAVALALGAHRVPVRLALGGHSLTSLEPLVARHQHVVPPLVTELPAFAQRLLDVFVVPVVLVPVVVIVVVEGFGEPPAEEPADDGAASEGRRIAPEACSPARRRR